MNVALDINQFAAALIDGRLTEDDLTRQDCPVREHVIECLFDTATGRRWLRNSSLLTGNLAARLLDHTADFRQQRFDATLTSAVQRANLEALVEHAASIAAGSGAPALWSRLAGNEEAFAAALEATLANGSVHALEATATHLLLDSSENYGLTTGQRATVAVAILDTDVDVARAVAAEFLAAAEPARLSERLDVFAHDDSASVRGFAWQAAFLHDRRDASDRAVELLGDESAGVEARRSALNAAGATLPTDEMVGLLSYFVVHPTRALALDAANLLYRHHRHPEIAIAAAGSPHDEVQEIANRLMDPYRGSPAAGGSRPGDPLRSDPMLDLIRQLQEETEE